MYTALKPKTNTAALQEDLHKLDKWAQNRKMKFDLEKCRVIPVIRNKTVIKTQYMLHGQILETKYLGITITSDLWDSYTFTYINQLEMIQCCAARYVLHRHNTSSSVTNMLQTLGWRSLSDRRNDAKLCMIYKITNGLVGN